jgi:hypothetical protein
VCFRFLCVHCHDSCETARARIRPRLDDYLYLYRTDDRRRAAHKSTRQRLQSHQPVARRLSPLSAATKSARDGALGRERTEALARGLAGAYTGERRRRCSTRARAATRGRADGTACTAARRAPSPPFPRRPRRLARCTASARAVMRRASRHASSSTGGLRGGRRARSVSERAGKGGHSHTYQEHAHCARARALDAVGRACSCRMRLEGILRVPKSL